MHPSRKGRNAKRNPGLKVLTALRRGRPSGRTKAPSEDLSGKDGLLHISEIDWKRLETVEEAGIKEGDKMTVKLLDIDPKTGKFKLSRRALLPKPEGYVERPPRQRRERPERGEHGGEHRPRREE